MSKTTWNIYKSLEQMEQACEKYKECDKCNFDDCPMRVWCLDEYDFNEIALNVSHDTVRDFIEGADRLVIPDDREVVREPHWTEYF